MQSDIKALQEQKKRFADTDDDRLDYKKKEAVRGSLNTMQNTFASDMNVGINTAESIFNQQAVFKAK